MSISHCCIIGTLFSFHSLLISSLSMCRQSFSASKTWTELNQEPQPVAASAECFCKVSSWHVMCSRSWWQTPLTLIHSSVSQKSKRAPNFSLCLYLVPSVSPSNGNISSFQRVVLFSQPGKQSYEQFSPASWSLRRQVKLRICSCCCCFLMQHNQLFTFARWMWNACVRECSLCLAVSVCYPWLTWTLFA